MNSEFDDDRSSLQPIGFAGAWLRAGEPRDFWFGLPALVALILLMLAVAVSAREQQLSAKELVDLAAGARERGNNELAALYVRKSAAAAESRQDEYDRGVALLRAGQQDDAVDVMRGLAPEDSRGFRLAHQWLLEHYKQQLGSGQITEGNRQQRAVLAASIEAHCRRLIEFDSRHLEAHHTLAEIESSRGNVPGVIKHLSYVVDKKESARLLYSRLLAAEGRDNEAKQQAQLAVDYYMQAIDATNADDDRSLQAHRLSLATAYMLLKDFKSAGQTLIVDGQPPASDKGKQLLVEALVAQTDEQPSNDRGVEQRQKLLEQALVIVPDHPLVIARLNDLLQSGGTAQQRAKQTLEKLLAAGVPSWRAHFSLGGLAYRKGDLGTAKTHFIAAHNINSDYLPVINNLAYVLAHCDEPDLQRALELVNRAIEADPDFAEFRDTRGAIYVKMERWHDAISDFEISLKKYPQRIKTHRALAEAYQAIGDEELADIHRRAVRRLQ